MASEAKFQRLQKAFAAHVRNPAQTYQGEAEGGLFIEGRRLAAYEELVFNNFDQFFSNLFPVVYQIVDQAVWSQLLRGFVQRHSCQTPLFHELGQEFLVYLQNQTQIALPEFILELAHYEWVEMAVSIEDSKAFEPKMDEKIRLDANYQWSPLAWPLVYNWPVDQISKDFQPEKKPDAPTCLLVYRSADYQVKFMSLSPALYELIQTLSASKSRLADVFNEVSNKLAIPSEQVATFALPVCQQFLEMGLMTQVKSKV